MTDQVDKSWVCIHMQPKVDIVHVTSNIADRRAAELYAEALQESGWRVIAICSTVELICAVAEIED